MTRETKIGLLVGLAFIIVIGILLSDHLTARNESAPAQFDKASSTVLSSVRTPGQPQVAAVPPVNSTTVVAPQTVVPTNEDLTPRVIEPPVQHIAIGPSATPPPAGGNQTISIGPGTVAPTAVEPAPAQAEPARIPIGPVVSRTPDHPVAGVAQQAGVDVVPVGLTNSTPPAPRGPANNEYQAQAGDNLGRLAAKLPGGNTKANRDAIVKANPSLQQNPDLIVAGRTYVLPTVSAAVVPAPAPTPAVTKAPSKSSATESWYTVKKGDGLWKIANEQLGDASATTITLIKELNKEQLKGSDLIREGMKLRLPAKTVASAN